MKLLDGLRQIRQLSDARQRQFRRFAYVQKQFRLRPVLADLSLFMTLIGTAAYLVSEKLLPSWEPKALFTWVYAVILLILAIVHRTHRRLRHASPCIVYLMFFHMATFNYLGYVVEGGKIDNLIGLHLFISSLGFITLSIRHSSILVAADLLFMAVSTRISAGPEHWAAALTSVLSHWVILMSLVIAVLSAVFNRWLFDNIIALQFLLKDRNKLLAKTLQSLKNTEDALIQQQKHQALSHMAKGLLHEIMNPLNGAAQAMHYARTINRAPKVAEAINDAVIQQERIASIIQDLIHFASPKPENAPEQTQLTALLDNALRFCKVELRDTEVSIENERPVVLYCYPSAITQVLVNLLMNAQAALKGKFPQGGGHIEIRMNYHTASVRIHIRDNGQGIAPTDLPRLSDPFYSTRNTPENLGLGLSICQTIIRHHHGRMTIESQEGQWTEVTIELPVDPFATGDFSKGDSALEAEPYHGEN